MNNVSFFTYNYEACLKGFVLPVASPLLIGLDKPGVEFVIICRITG